MDHFDYHNGILHAEGVPLPKIALEVGTPFYCYSSATLSRHYTIFSEAFSAIPTTVCFAVKSNSNQAVLTTLAKLGAGADTVSEGEIRRARAAGIPASKIVFSGVGKTRNEIRYALGVGIGQFNVESHEELSLLSQEACDLGVTAPIAFRVNPDIDAGTHNKISTGRKTDKFGIAWEDAIAAYNRAGTMKGIKVVGIACHIGSQLTSLNPFQLAFKKLTELVETLRKSGHHINRVDLGGGLGIPYETGKELPPHPQEYASMIVDTIKHLDCELILEPGRLIVGNAGILVTSVVQTKNTQDRNFIIVDAGMNDLIRPSMYDAWHDIVPAIQTAEDSTQQPFDIVGPVCESGDTFGKQRMMTPVKTDDLLAIRSAGAYGAVMSSTYNTRPMIPEIMVHNDDYAVIRQRPSYDELINQDIIPEWL